MTASITLADGRIWWASNAGYDRVLEAIVDVLPTDDDSVALGSWLLEQRCEEQGPGLGAVDVRELTPSNQERFVRSLPHARDHAVRLGAATWFDPAAFPAWLENFTLLCAMAESVARGEPPEACSHPHAAGVASSTGLRRGPGWR